MELTKKQLSLLKRKISKGASLKKVLTTKFQNATIYVIRGFDNFSYEAYTEGAYFSKKEAFRVMDNIPPNGTLPDSYCIVSGTIKMLENGEGFDYSSSHPIDDIDKDFVYSQLEDILLKEAEK